MNLERENGSARMPARKIRTFITECMAQASAARCRSLLTTGVVLLAAGTGPLARAQDAADKPAGSTTLDEIVVTGSRITVSGFEAPTPVTVLGQAELENRGTTNIASALNQLPAFYASTTPASTTLQGTTNGYNIVELRILGASRTLVLLDGRRHVPTSLTGVTNLNVIPVTAVSRIEVVTGGASAAWGSDAVAGVVNILLDDKLEGLRTQVQYGASTHGDAGNLLASVALGSSFRDGRGHFTIAAQYNDEEGIASQTDRDWGRRSWGIVGNPGGPPNRLIIDDVNLAGVTEGGLIRGPAPIANIQFGPGGTLLAYQPGSIISGSFQVGGDGADMGQYRDLTVPFSLKSIFSHVDYELNDAVSSFFEASFAQFEARSETVQPFDLGGVPIQADNAFIPAALRTTLTGNNITSFRLFRINTDFGFTTADTENRTIRAVFGFKGELPKEWSWDAYYQYGHTQITNLDLNNRIEANYQLAVDAVVNPANGSIVCRASLTGGAPGCAPINLFGFGSPSPQALAYVLGTEFLQNNITQQVAAASVQGAVMELPAGSLSAAAGVEYREEKITAEADDIATRGGYLIGNFVPIGGSYDVKEAFAEMSAPLLKDLPAVNALDINGAIRYTDYSTSGSVNTWKAGLNYRPIADLRLRATVSRDIRAPNINELFTSQGLTFTNVNDPRTNTTVFTRVVTGGNTGLLAEEADTQTVGLVYQPRWASKLQFSADWYDIDIDGAISSLGAQTLVNNCEAGDGAACAAVTRDGAGAITQVDQRLLNIAQLHVSGIDFEASYGTRALNRLGLDGELTFRGIANRVNHVQRRNSVSDRFVENVGGVGPDGGTVPHWRGILSATYESGPLTVFAQARYIGSGKFNINFTPNDLADNDVSAVTYLDTSVRYDFGHEKTSGIELYVGVNNVLDKDPPIVPVNFIVPLATNAVLYDVVGRYVYGGLRARF